MTDSYPAGNGDPFCGTWQLDPAECQYEMGAPPRSATYRIEAEGQALKMTIDWVSADGQSATIVYRGIPDGHEHPSLDNPDVADTLIMKRLDPSTLDTISSKSGQVLGHARRTLSPDGRTMKIVQSTTTDEGIVLRNTSVYIKR